MSPAMGATIQRHADHRNGILGTYAQRQAARVDLWLDDHCGAVILPVDADWATPYLQCTLALGHHGPHCDATHPADVWNDGDTTTHPRTDKD